MPRSTCALFVVILCAALAIAGCGGGSGGSTSTPPPDDASNPTPSVASVTPSSATAGSAATAITVSGTGFVSASAIQWNGGALTTTFVSSSSLQATIPASDLVNGTSAKLTVTNPTPGGGTSAALSFTVNNPVPAITSITPANATAGSADLLVTVNGSGFVPSTIVTWNGASLNTTFVSSTQLTATLPAADLATVSLSSITAQNPAPSGGTSAGMNFEVRPAGPVIQSISPRIVKPGSPATTVTLTGYGFTNASVVLWDASSRPTTYVSSTQLQVLLSAADLLSPQSGELQVSNPGPAGIQSAPVELAVSSSPLPTIQSVAIAGNAFGADPSCPQQLGVTINGTNFSAGDTGIRANGILLPTNGYITSTPTTVANSLPSGFVANPGALSFTLTTQDNNGVFLTSDPYVYPTSAPPAIAICLTPYIATVYPSSTFHFTVKPSEVNVSGNATVKLGTLPAGITSSASSFPMPAGGTIIHLSASSTVATGSYALPLTATFGTASGSNEFDFTVASGTAPGFSFVSVLDNEVGVPIGRSGRIAFLTTGDGLADYEVTPSVSGLPTGTTATFSPATFIPGESVTVTLTAASNAPVQQNVPVTLTGTPSGSAPPATASFFADVTQPPGSLANSRTDYVSTAGTPSSGTYDRVHNLIFVSNPDWNRVDVISNVTHKIVKSVPIRGAISVDITQDCSLVWVQTMTPQVYAINTTSLQATRYTLPPTGFTGPELNLLDVRDRILALSDGTVFLDFGYDGATQYEVWNPQTNQLTVLATASDGLAVRSGDGAHVFSIGGSSLVIYDVATKTINFVANVPQYGSVVAVNQDGSRLIMTGFTSLNTMTLFDRNLNNLGNVPGTIPGLGIQSPLDGGTLFSADGTTLYEIEQSLILTIDASTLQVIATAPAAPVEPLFTSGAADTATPFAVDSTGMILALQNFGVSFEDSTFIQNYGSLPVVGNGTGNLTPASGPLSGGTPIDVDFLNVTSNLTPDAWFGQTRGTLGNDNGSAAIFSPPSGTPGPVNVKLIYPSGIQGFFPNTFTYSSDPEYVVTGGSGPSGGVPGRILGYGLPKDLTGGSLAIGGASATITTQPNASVYSGEALPTTLLDFTIPAGTPGWSDLAVTTPAGTGTLPKSIFYAKSITDYSSADTFSNLLVDEARHQVYVSAGDHVDVFSTTSNQFISSLHPATVGAQKQFTGMALTPDGTQLLVANFADGSLAVINPDSPSTTFAIGGLPKGSNSGCALGPVYVAASSTGLAFVTIRGLPGCFAGPDAYTVNLQTRTAAEVPSASCFGQNVQATSDGNYVVLDGLPCIYVSQTGVYLAGGFPSLGFGITVSGDGNVIANQQFLSDLTPNLVGILPRPVALFGQPGSLTQPTPVFGTQLNASGSLYFAPFANNLEITDVAHGRLRLRFTLAQTVQNTSGPMAIDSGGRFIYLITDRGLTVVDMGAALLSIGHVSNAAPTVGSQITVRGSGFDSTVTATVGGVAATVSFTDENTLTLTIPAAPSGPQDIVLTRTGTYADTYTLENAVVLP